MRARQPGCRTEAVSQRGLCCRPVSVSPCCRIVDTACADAERLKARNNESFPFYNQVGPVGHDRHVM